MLLGYPVLTIIWLGVKNAETIIAVILTLMHPPIVTQTDYVLFMDIFKSIPEMIRWLDENPRTSKQLKQSTNII
ncbi:MAG: hypothetical protein ACKESC_01330 [Candidatus Hodgkinia cicadicola]